MALETKLHSTSSLPATRLPERPTTITPPTFPDALPEGESLKFSPSMIKKAEQFTLPHRNNIEAACQSYDNICSPELLEGVVFSHQLLEQLPNTSNKNIKGSLPNASCDPKSLKDIASDLSENLKRLYFIKIESRFQEDSSQGMTFDESIATMEKMSESEVKIALAQYYSNFMQQNNSKEGLSNKDIVGLAQDSVNYEHKNSEDWQEIKKHIDSPELLAFVENAYNYSRQPRGPR